jgi:hypothetical protein
MPYTPFSASMYNEEGSTGIGCHQSSQISVDLPHVWLVVTGFLTLPRFATHFPITTLRSHVDVVTLHEVKRLAGVFSSPPLPHDDHLGITHPPTPFVLMLVIR